MSVVTYAGDEVGALVLDVGSTWTKAGYAGEDAPDAYFPTVAGFTPDGSGGDGDAGDADAMNVDGSAGAAGSSRGAWHLGETNATQFRPGMELRRPITDGVVSDWDAFERTLDYTFKNHLRVAEDEHPLLMAEPAWNPRAAREKLTELVFEQHQFPAFFLARNPVLASFASGKGTALIVEVGGGSTSVTPVHEGYVLQKAIQHQHLGGDFISLQALLTFNYNKIHIAPPYAFKARAAVPLSAPASVTQRELQGVTESYRQYMQLHAFDDFKHSIAATWKATLHEQQHHAHFQMRAYEFPCGYSNHFSAERYRLAECLFQPDRYVIPPPADGAMRLTPGVPPSGALPAPVKSLPEMLKLAMNAVDPDMRPAMLANVIVTGGTAAGIPGFADRVVNELARLYPSAKVKCVSGSSMAEKKYGAWLGGSILASLGVFHQLWISRKEYEEHGAGIVEKKCV